MRILSQVELQRTGLLSEIPVDLSAQYFPAVLRAYTYKNGERLIDRDRDVIDGLFVQAKSVLDCERLFRITKKSSGIQFHDEQIISSSRLIPQHKQDNQTTEFKTLNVMFPVDRLIFQDELADEKITATPGMLYFRAHFQFTARRYSSKGSVYLNEEDYQISLRSKRSNSRDPQQGGQPVEKPKKWRGPIADIEQLTNSRVVKERAYEDVYSKWHQEYRDQFEYILETPFEFPPGFVHESVNVFTNRWTKISKAAKLFCDLVRGSPLENAEASKELEKRDKFFPHGIAHHRGPDVAWQRCEKPWFVQTMLLARLIGGRYWQYALGYLESKMRGGVVDF